MNIKVHRTIRSKLPRLHFVGLYTSMVFVMILILQYLNCFKSIDDFIFQKISSNTKWSHAASKVIGVEIGRKKIDTYSASEWAELFKRLRDVGAETIIVTSPVKVQLIDPSDLKNVVFGISENELKIENNPKLSFLSANSVPWGVADPWQDYKTQTIRSWKSVPGEQGENLFNTANNKLNLNSLPTLDLQVYRKYNSQQTPTRDFYRINPVQGYKRIPVITLTEFLNAMNVKKLLENKVIILGSALDNHPVLTNIASLQDPISQTHFWSLAIDSIITDSYLRHISFSAYAFILLLFTCCLLITQMFTGNAAGALVLFSMNFIYTLVSWKLLEKGNIYLPMGSFYVTSIALYCIYSFDSRSYSATIVQDLNASFRSKINSLNIDYSDIETSQFWSNLVKYFLHNIDLKRVALLEVQPGQKDLKLLASHNCDLESLNYQIQDFTRPPYSSLKKGLSAQPLSEKAFKDKSDNNLYFLIALTTRRKSYGYLYLSIESSYFENIEVKFFNLTKSLTAHILKLLIYRAEKLQPKSLTARAKVFFQNELQEKKALELERLFMKINQNIDFLSSYASSVTTGAAVYDLFGNLVFSNKSMQHLMIDSRIDFESLSAPELISNVTGMEKDSTLSYIRTALLDREVVVLPSIISMPHKWKVDSTDFIEVDLKLSVVQGDSHRDQDSFNISNISILIEILQKESSQGLLQQISTNELSPVANELDSNRTSFENLFTIVTSKYKSLIEEKEITIEATNSLDYHFSGGTESLKKSLDYFIENLINEANQGSILYCSLYEKDDNFQVMLESQGAGLVQDISTAAEQIKSHAGEKSKNLVSLQKTNIEDRLTIYLVNNLGRGTSLILTRPKDCEKVAEQTKNAA